MSGGDTGDKAGFRKDGKPYKEGNTRADGSYLHGKYRTPEHGKFRKDDGRKRGKREKGSKNLSSIWAKQLSRKMTINGETKTAAEWVVDAMIRRGITRSDRAAENALAALAQIELSRECSVVGREDQVIAAYLAQYLAGLATPVSEDQPEEYGDADLPGSDSEDDGNAGQ